MFNVSFFLGHPAYFLFMKSKRTNFAGAPLIMLSNRWHKDLFSKGFHVPEKGQNWNFFAFLEWEKQQA